MDERQQQGVQVGAGLQESRLNTDLIEWLKKWGNHVLLVIIVIVLAYVGIVWYGKYQLEKRGEAFAQYEAARGIMGPDGVLLGSPDNLLRLAEEKAGWGSVKELATLDAAEVLLGCARRGIGPGADVLAPADTDLLTEQQTEEMMTRARSLFDSVRQSTDGDTSKTLLHLRSLWGVAASNASLGDFEVAASVYDQIATKAQAAELPDYVARAAEEKARLESFKTPVVAIAEADLPEEMRPRDPGKFSPQNLPQQGPAGSGPQNAIPIQIGPDGKATIPVRPPGSADPVQPQPQGAGTTGTGGSQQEDGGKTGG